MNKEKILGYAVVLVALGYFLHLGAVTDLPTASVAEGGVDGCTTYVNGECTQYAYNNEEHLNTVDSSIEIEPRTTEGFLKPLLFQSSASPDVEGVCLERVGGDCVLKKQDGRTYVKVAHTENDIPQASILGGIGSAIGGLFGGSDDGGNDVDVSVGDETEVQYSDGSTETYTSDDDETGDGWTETGSGTSDSSDTSDSSGGSGSWWNPWSGSDDSTEETVTVTGTYEKCGGKVYENAVIPGEPGVTGYEKKIEVTEYSDGTTEEEVVQTVNSFDIDIQGGERPRVCIQPTQETAKFVESHTEANIYTLIGRIGLIP